MKTEQQLHSEYADVLNAADDTSLVRLVGRLDDAFATQRYGVPDRLTAAVDRLVNDEAARSAGKGRGLRRLLTPFGRPQTRMGWVVAILMVLVALGAGGYGVGSQIVGQNSFTMLTGQKPDLVVDLGMTQTVDGVTFSLERVYVTGDRIGLDVLVTGMPEPYDEPELYYRFMPTGGLTALDGTVLQSVGGSTVRTADGDTVGQYATAYEMDRPEGAPSELHLQAKASVWEFVISKDDQVGMVEQTTFAGPVVF